MGGGGGGCGEGTRVSDFFFTKNPIFGVGVGVGVRGGGGLE